MKLLIKKIIFFFKSFLSLDQLNSFELTGKLANYSKFKFIPKTPLNVPFDLGRTARGIAFKNLNNFNLKEDKQDYIGKQYIDQLNGMSNDQLIKNFMSLLHKEENLTAADIMNCPNNKYLKCYPAWASVSPWDKLSTKNKYVTYLASFIENRNKHGASFYFTKAELKKEEIYSVDIAISHIKQNEKLIKSFREKGILKPNKLSLPRVFILIKNSKEWRWIMASEGTHRSYLFYFFGLKKFSVIIEDVVYRESLESCYNVRNGIYSLEEAEKIFDGIFNGSSYIRGII